MTDKSAMRRTIRAARRQRPAADRAAVGRAVARNVMALPAVASAGAEGRVNACYSATQTEPPTAELVAALLARGVRVLLPRVCGPDLEWVPAEPGRATTTGSFGIEEPTGASAGIGFAPLADAAAIVLPAHAVDGRGRRLGQGGGFYDRLLAAAPRHLDGGPLLAAVVFDDEILEDVPAQPHDHAVDVAVTPVRTVWFPRDGVGPA